MSAVSVQQVFNAYPGSPAVGVEVTDDTEFDEVSYAIAGDSLFLFVCRELCEEDTELPECVKRLNTAIADLAATRDALVGGNTELPHMATLMATHVHTIVKMIPLEKVRLSLGTVVLVFERNNAGNFTVGIEQPHAAVGNVFGALQWYMAMALTTTPQIVVIDNG